MLLGEIPTLSQLYRLAELSPASRPVVSQASARYNSLVSLVRTDITTLEVSAIVNAANRSLRGGGGVDGVIHARAGPGLLRECKTLAGCETGSAKITAAYDLPCDKVIHAVGPVYWSAKNERAGLEKELLRGCYRTSLDLAERNACTSIAFSALSTGVYGYPSGEAAEEAIGEVRDWLDERGDGCGGLERIVFCCFERKDEVAYQNRLPRYFPPTERDLSPPSLQGADEEERTAEGAGGAAIEPHNVAPDTDEEWETVDHPATDSAFDGSEGKLRQRMNRSEEDLAMRESERTEEQAAALHAAESGTMAERQRNALEKDW